MCSSVLVCSGISTNLLLAAVLNVYKNKESGYRPVSRHSGSPDRDPRDSSMRNGSKNTTVIFQYFKNMCLCPEAQSLW